MKAFSSALSITAHVAVAAAVLLGTTKPGQSAPRPIVENIEYATIQRSEIEQGSGIASTIDIAIAAPPNLNSISVPGLALQPGNLIPNLSPTYSPSGNALSVQPGGGAGMEIEEHAEVLSGPLPVYPDLLRQAGVQGTVVLEAVVDTTGRVLAASLRVVMATNPGFVAPARQALLATLFRPARIGVQPVQMLVRIPYEFAIRSGTGHAR